MARDMTQRLLRSVLPALLLALFVALAVRGARWMSLTFDEPMHITAGYMALRFGDFRAGPNHPPLIRMWSALPAALDRTISFSVLDPAYRLGKQKSIAGMFLLVLNRLEPILDRARLMIILLAAALGLVIHRWAGSLFGPVAAAAALFLFVFEPNLMANGSLVTTDLGVTLFFALTGLFLARVFRRLSPGALTGLALAFAAAQVSKFSALVLYPAVAVVLVWRALDPRPWEVGRRGERAVRGRGRKLAAAAAVMALLCVSALTAIWGVYRCRYEMAPAAGLHYDVTEDPEFAASERARGEALGRIRFLPEGYVRGAAQLLTWPQAYVYFAGKVHDRPIWYFYPAVLLLKTPTAVLVLSALALWLAVRRPRLRPEGWPALLVLPLSLLLAGMASRVNTGVRHLLPVFPFLLLAAGAAAGWLAGRRRGRVLLAALGILTVGEFSLAYPDTLASFNLLAGGPARGDRWLAGTDMDWGQGLKALGSWMRANDVEEINLACHNTLVDESLGFRAHRLPIYRKNSMRMLEDARLPGYVAVSASVLTGYTLEGGDNPYKVFRDMAPVALIGRSIRVYWVEKPWWRSGPMVGRVP
jgi:hypothetical protein